MSGEKNTVEFKFNLGDIVVNPLGGRGIIDLAGIERGGVKYGVKDVSGEYSWWQEELLTKTE